MLKAGALFAETSPAFQNVHGADGLQLCSTFLAALHFTVKMMEQTVWRMRF